MRRLRRKARVLANLNVKAKYEALAPKFVLPKMSAPREQVSMSNDSDNRISMKNIFKVTHVYGAEPAGILLQMTTSDGELIDIFLSKALAAETQEILRAALEKYLPH
jgi:hypothetical protein